MAFVDDDKIEEYLKSVVDEDGERVYDDEDVSIFMDDEDGFIEESSYFDDPEKFKDKDIEDWIKECIDHYLGNH